MSTVSSVDIVNYLFRIKNDRGLALKHLFVL